MTRKCNKHTLYTNQKKASLGRCKEGQQKHNIQEAAFGIVNSPLFPRGMIAKLKRIQGAKTKQVP